MMKSSFVSFRTSLLLCIYNLLLHFPFLADNYPPTQCVNQKNIVNIIKYVNPFLDNEDKLAASNAFGGFYSIIHQYTFSSIDLVHLDQSHQSLTSSAFENYCDEIGRIANGDSIKAIKNVRLLKYVQKSFYTCPIHGHFVEGGVKDTTFIG